jgi:Zn-dependent peptidase ImmA (M78 family)
MNKQKLEQIEKRADEILRETNAWQIPVPIDHVARRLSLTTEAGILGEDISGALVVEKGRGAIGYNSTHARVRQRFTIAHEIGHYVLHIKNPLQSRLFVDGYVAFRNDESSVGNDWQEVEANAFGAALLMPANLVREEIKQRKLDLDDEDDLNTLAKQFHVSPAAMSYRLINLGLLR